MKVTTNLVWKGLEDPTVEHCTVLSMPGQLLVQSKIEGPVNDQHTIVKYKLVLDSDWTLGSVELTIAAPTTEQHIRFTHNKYGEWVDDDLHTHPELDGCLDIDISLTPFTNTLPVKRLCFKPGESHAIKVLYFDLPAFTIKMQQQRYTFLGDNRFKFESLDTGYTNEISFNTAGFVQQYPGLFELVGA